MENTLFGTCPTLEERGNLYSLKKPPTSCLLIRSKAWTRGIGLDLVIGLVKLVLKAYINFDFDFYYILKIC